ncbi:YdcF family protein [Spirulina sp. CS-785/01]|uniref:YdcF family protein n=1 Tax=Spirulina sp. CS-785/01 TaxID=3021716 RepID=UPI0023307BAC|nr:YdcF family protein [Spirulina sp. CS-785/01]MDB9312112.1 YdcF family protein [Spirulina sp. CS-785/01]
MKWRWLKYLGLTGLGIFLGWILFLFLRLQGAANQPVDTLFVLGGSIRREMYITELLQQQPDQRVLISNGAPDPCVLLLFERANAPLTGVWLERCARNTFGNFYYSTPILKQWGARHIKLITSQSHLPRAIWMAQIHLGAQGIWVDLDVAEETGIPGNQEFLLKTVADVGRSFLWAIIGQFFQPECDRITYLPEVELASWLEKGFECEHQAGLDDLIQELQGQRL